MIRIIDTYGQIDSLFEGGAFRLDKWEAYINAIYPNASRLFWDEVNEYIHSGRYTFEKDFLPVINAANRHPLGETLHKSFAAVTQDLEKRVAERFGKTLDVDIVLYLGLCIAAGWVTEINGTTAVLLGVEKILELGWHTGDAMTGLILHELGHVYQAQHGVLERSSGDTRKDYVWQLFTEGIAMYFEQALQGDFRYYHQDKDGWTGWCDTHFPQILADFDQDLPGMTQFTQRYFGDWCDYHGRGDVGYYLGARFVQELAERRSLDELIVLDQDAVWDLYAGFVRRHQP